MTDAEELLELSEDELQKSQGDYQEEIRKQIQLTLDIRNYKQQVVCKGQGSCSVRGGG